MNKPETTETPQKAGCPSAPCSRLPETPETDAESLSYEIKDLGQKVYSTHVSTKFAQKLERERDDARRQWSIHQDKGAELHIRLIDANRDLENLRHRCRQLIKHRGHLAADAVLDLIAEMLPENDPGDAR